MPADGNQPQAAAPVEGIPVEETPVEAQVIEADEHDGQQVDEDAVAQEVDEVFSMADIEKARADAKAANDKFLRLQAEWDNFRKRTAREREDEKARATEGLVMKLLPVVDDIERSLDHADQGEPQGAYAEFVQGVRAVYDKLVDALKRTGVEAIDPAGKPFDMNEHQAIAQVPDDTVPDNTVKDVYQKGYRMGGRVIRTAMVTVAKGGPAQPAPAED